MGKQLLCLLALASAHNMLVGKHVTEHDIVMIYKKFVKPYQTEANKSRYIPLPMHKNNIPNWAWKGRDFPRVISLLEFERFVNEHNLSSAKALALNSHHDPEWHYLPKKEIVAISYDDDKRHDLHTLDLAQKDFDFVMVNQTLEHVYDPVLCLKNIYNHMRSGAILYFNVPATSIPHTTPFHHYMGITPVGAGAIAMAAGFNILHIGQWGNEPFLTKMFKDYTFHDYQCMGENIGLNDFRYPVITWVFAQKP